MDTRLEVTVVIPAHNAAQTLADQLTALTAQIDAPPFEVVVALNRCTDTTGAVAREFADHLDLRVIHADDLPGAAHARNAGVAAARGDLLLFCDADDVARPGWVAALVTQLRMPGVDVAAGTVEVLPSSLPGWMVRWQYGDVEGSTVRTGVLGHAYALAGSFGCRRGVFTSVGGFSEVFTSPGGEDEDFGMRVTAAGYAVVPAPSAVMGYRPRDGMWSAMRRWRGYRRAGAEIAARDGRLVNAPSHSATAAKSIRVAAHLVVRQHERNPLYIAARMYDQFLKAAAERRVLRQYRSRSAS